MKEDTVNEGWMGQFTKLEESFWDSDGTPFELGSVMTYCSFCAGDPAMTLKDGSTWGNHGRITSTDITQVNIVIIYFTYYS